MSYGYSYLYSSYHVYCTYYSSSHFSACSCSLADALMFSFANTKLQLLLFLVSGRYKPGDVHHHACPKSCLC
eukprot:2600811-Amphidinium_carterae.2